MTEEKMGPPMSKKGRDFLKSLSTERKFFPGGEMRDGIHMTNCEYVILNELTFKRTTRKSIAMTIALAFKSYEDEEKMIDWKKIGKACIEKWSPSGYEYILKLAWSGKCFE